jgi:Carboxypeptidase regulatory-like domain
MKISRLLALLVSIAFPCTFLGQSTSASITGVVDDPAKATLPNVSVTAINTQTGVRQQTRTSNEGAYVLTGLIPGTYRMEVDKQGFKGIIEAGLTLHVQDVVQMNFHMAVGSMSESVTVDADSVNINTTNASVSTVIDRQFVESLPLNGRSFQSLLYLSPGITPNVATGGTNYAQGQFVVNGQRGDMNYWTVDGVSANVGMSVYEPGAAIGGGIGGTNALGGTSALVSVDALQEFRVETSTYAPEFGRLPGGQIVIQTRSGTNQFHGMVFDYLRNAVLDASDWLANHNGLAKAGEIQNDFGGVFGGPILHDKTFFFFSTEGLRLHLPKTFVGTVPDLATRASALPAMQPYLEALPQPKAGAADTSVGSGIAPFSTTYSDPGTADAFSLRLDHQLSDHLNVFARYNHAPSSTTQRNADATAANVALVLQEITKTATAGATWLISPHVTDDFRFNYSTAGGKAHWATDDLGGGTPFPSANLFPAGNGFTFANSNILMLPTFGTNMREWSGFQANTYQHQLNFVNTATWQVGAHDLKIGADYRHLSPFANSQTESQILPFFADMQDMAAGIASDIYVYNEPALRARFQNLGLFLQDSWRLNPRLSLTYGLRWDIDFSPVVTAGSSHLAALTGYSAASTADLALGPAGAPPYATRYGNFAPRVGGAYQLSTDPAWGAVLRGGFGIYYGLASSEILNVNDNNGFYPLSGYNVYSKAVFPTAVTNPPLPVIVPPTIANGETLGGFDPHLNLPYAMEWSVAVEQSLGKTQTFSLSYLGTSDKRLLASEFINNPNPNYVQAFIVGNAGYSNFQSLQAQFRRRMANGLQTLLSYVWSHSIDTGSYGGYTNGGFGDVKANRGDSDFDNRNSFSAAVTYNFPVWQANFFTRALTGGWSTDNEIQIHSGPPVDVIDEKFTAFVGENTSILIRPDIVPGQPRYLTGPQYPGNKALNPAAFTDPPVDPITGEATRQGNLSRNASRSLGMAQWNFAAHREFPIYERLKLQFRGELFNALNHPNFGPFNNALQAGNIYFGQSTEMLNQYLGGNAGTGSQNSLYTPGSPESGELALKLIF